MASSRLHGRMSPSGRTAPGRSRSAADFVMRRVLFGVALHQDRGDEFIERLEGELAELEASPPPVPELAPPAA